MKKDEATDTGSASAAGEAGRSTQMAVSELLEERRRFESWIAALDARRDTTPPNVFARVHADYSTRLTTVVNQLTEHTGELEDELTSLTSRLGALHDEQQQARDERAEAELRAHVGELSAEEWERTARAADERIDGLTSRHADMEMELQRTRALLGDAARPMTPAGSLPAVAVAAQPQAHAESAPAPERVSSSETPAPTEEVPDSAEGALHVPGGESGSAADEMPTEVTASVIAAEAELDEAANMPADGAPKPFAASFDEMAFLNSVVDIPKESPAPPDKASEGGKTLKCAECSAMNLPTDWYCERCGAELASL